MTRIPLALIGLLALAACSDGAKTEGPAIALTLKDHKFSPTEIEVKANQPAVIEVTNADNLAEEFDSDTLKVEKVVAGGQKGTVRLRPLPPGRYPFMGEYHAKTAQGVVIAK
jgi:hypothetical protein